MLLLEKRTRRGGRRVRRVREKRKGRKVTVRVGNLNVGSMTGERRELADLMERRKCLGSKQSVGHTNEHEAGNRRGADKCNQCIRPHVGCERQVKEDFWTEVDELLESIPMEERVMIGADFNGHVRQGNRGDEDVMGRHGVKDINEEGQMIVDFAKRMDFAVVNTFFEKKMEHRVTYKSGGRSTQVDYILYRRCNVKEIKDCKVIPGESVVKQHRIVVCSMTLIAKVRKQMQAQPRIKWWRLK
ncbi:uncharacterized protein LOC117101710 [Anneissia japonica]|uniref:uncharacterized protein LOC117101710 n=1 Tax=Anneissia japonica TaxID=1529436 RepID=UPI0014258590|nr:uncharacterized protein LOC117101710 [Anneissia japonica]